MPEQPPLTIPVRTQDVIAIQHQGRTVKVKGAEVFDKFAKYEFEKPLLERLRSIHDDLRFKYDYRSFTLTVTTAEFIDREVFDESFPWIGSIREFKSYQDVEATS